MVGVKSYYCNPKAMEAPNQSLPADNILDLLKHDKECKEGIVTASKIVDYLQSLHHLSECETFRLNYYSEMVYKLEAFHSDIKNYLKKYLN